MDLAHVALSALGRYYASLTNSVQPVASPDC